MIGNFLKWFFGLVALALIAWAVVPYGLGLLELVKFIAVAVGASIVILFVYPHVRGVKKGDPLLSIKMSTSPVLFFNASMYTALEDGKKGDRIGVMISDGTMAEGVIVAYEGLLTPARIRLTHEASPSKVNEITVV